MSGQSRRRTAPGGCGLPLLTLLSGVLGAASVPAGVGIWRVFAVTRPWRDGGMAVLCGFGAAGAVVVGVAAAAVAEGVVLRAARRRAEVRVAWWVFPLAAFASGVLCVVGLAGVVLGVAWVTTSFWAVG